MTKLNKIFAAAKEQTTLGTDRIAIDPMRLHYAIESFSKEYVSVLEQVIAFEEYAKTYTSHDTLTATYRDQLLQVVRSAIAKAPK